MTHESDGVEGAEAEHHRHAAGHDAPSHSGEHTHHAEGHDHHQHAAAHGVVQGTVDGDLHGSSSTSGQPPRTRTWQWLGLVVAGAGCLALGAGLAVLVHPGTPSGGSVAAAAEPVPEGGADGGLAAAAPTTVASTDPRRTSTDRGGPRFPLGSPVMLIGDSLAVGIADPLIADWPNREVVVDALEGRSTTTQAALLPYEVEGSPSIWVVSLGTNDAPEDFPAAAASIMQQAGPNRCVVWYDVHRAATDEEINPELAVLLEQHPNLHLIDWHDLADAHPEWFSVDDIHPDATGYEARARQAVQAVAEQCTSQE